MNAEQIIVPANPASKPLHIGVSVHDGQAVLHFSEPRAFIALDAAQALVIGTKITLAGVEANNAIGKDAIEMAIHLIDLVYEVRGDLKPAGGAVKHEMIERHRKTLTNRLSIVLNSQRERRKVSNAELAKQITEILLHEVFA